EHRALVADPCDHRHLVGAVSAPAENRVEREREVLEGLHREVVACCDTSEDQVSDAVEGVLSRQRQRDLLDSHLHPSNTTRGENAEVGFVVPPGPRNSTDRGRSYVRMSPAPTTASSS